MINIIKFIEEISATEEMFDIEKLEIITTTINEKLHMLQNCIITGTTKTSHEAVISNGGNISFNTDVNYIAKTHGLFLVEQVNASFLLSIAHELTHKAQFENLFTGSIKDVESGTGFMNYLNTISNSDLVFDFIYKSYYDYVYSEYNACLIGFLFFEKTLKKYFSDISESTINMTSTRIGKNILNGYTFRDQTLCPSKFFVRFVNLYNNVVIDIDKFNELHDRFCDELTVMDRLYLGLEVPGDVLNSILKYDYKTADRHLLAQLEAEYGGKTII